MSSRKGIIIALMVPIVFLAVVLIKSHYVWLVGERVVFSVQGFDPRDLISGNYISYRVNYNVPSVCGPHPVDLTKKPEAFMCLKPRMFSHEQPSSKDCKLYIKGQCRFGRFHAGIERFYLPETEIDKIDKLIRYHRVKIVVSVSSSGAAVVTDLLIDDKPWREFLKSLEPGPND